MKRYAVPKTAEFELLDFNVSGIDELDEEATPPERPKFELKVIAARLRAIETVKTSNLTNK